MDAVCTDPPYGLSFMDKKWDYDVPQKELWEAVSDKLRPGGHLLSFGGTRTYHRMVVEIEDAGFEIRDQIQWLYGTGFPKSHNVSKAIDKAAGAERKVVGLSAHKSGIANGCTGHHTVGGTIAHNVEITNPTTPEAKQWDGWGTALKPANEPIVLARKPLDGTVARNVLEHGTGALNIDCCRVGTSDDLNGGSYDPHGRSKLDMSAASSFAKKPSDCEFVQPTGRWPANVIHDGSEAVVSEFPKNKAARPSVRASDDKSNSQVLKNKAGEMRVGYFDEGSAARFFYCAKPSKKERGEHNLHPTVKPIDLIAYLCRLVTPPEGVVLDPFMGSGTTGLAALREGFHFIGIERDPEYFEIACKRLRDAQDG